MPLEITRSLRHDAGMDSKLMGQIAAVLGAAHAFVPGLIRRGKGSILFLVSVAGQTGSQTDPPYSAAKAALINFTQCAAGSNPAHAATRCGFHRFPATGALDGIQPLEFGHPAGSRGLD